MTLTRAMGLDVTGYASECDANPGVKSEIDFSRLENPKLGRTGSTFSEVFHYYAGFSENFVSSLIAGLNPGTDSVVLDPWNGSGTTTHVGSTLGLRTVGFDLNPAMVAIARARCIPSHLIGDLIAEADRIEENFISIDFEFQPKDDLLLTWFTSRAVNSIRKLLCVICKTCESSMHYTCIEKTSIKASLLFSVVANVVKRRLKPLKTSNPTWLRLKIAKNELIDFEPLELVSEFSTKLKALLPLLRSSNAQIESIPRLGVADSKKIPLADNSVDIVLSSPPYCTRIDYAMTTVLELALLGCKDLSGEFRDLRESLIGSSTVRKLNVIGDLGPSCEETLRQIHEHSSYASKRYYYKTFFSYFDSMNRSIAELSRVTKRGGLVCLVVQNSYYKEIEINLQEIFSDMGISYGLIPVRRHTFVNLKTKARVHPQIIKYSRRKIEEESVLVMQKK